MPHEINMSSKQNVYVKANDLHVVLNRSDSAKVINGARVIVDMRETVHQSVVVYAYGEEGKPLPDSITDIKVLSATNVDNQRASVLVSNRVRSRDIIDYRDDATIKNLFKFSAGDKGKQPPVEPKNATLPLTIDGVTRDWFIADSQTHTQVIQLTFLNPVSITMLLLIDAGVYMDLISQGISDPFAAYLENEGNPIGIVFMANDVNTELMILGMHQVIGSLKDRYGNDLVGKYHTGVSILTCEQTSLDFAKNLWSTLDKWLLGPDGRATRKPVFATGYSLGGALATMFPLVYGLHTSNVVTFGTAFAMDSGAAAAYEAVYPSYHYATIGDPLPILGMNTAMKSNFAVYAAAGVTVASLRNIFGTSSGATPLTGTLTAAANRVVGDANMISAGIQNGDVNAIVPAVDIEAQDVAGTSTAIDLAGGSDVQTVVSSGGLRAAAVRAMSLLVAPDQRIFLPLMGATTALIVSLYASRNVGVTSMLGISFVVSTFWSLLKGAASLTASATGVVTNMAAIQATALASPSFSYLSSRSRTAKFFLTLYPLVVVGLCNLGIEQMPRPLALLYPYMFGLLSTLYVQPVSNIKSVFGTVYRAPEGSGRFARFLSAVLNIAAVTPAVITNIEQFLLANIAVIQTYLFFEGIVANGMATPPQSLSCPGSIMLITDTTQNTANIKAMRAADLAVASKATLWSWAYHTIESYRSVLIMQLEYTSFSGPTITSAPIVYKLADRRTYTLSSGLPSENPVKIIRDADAALLGTLWTILNVLATQDTIERQLPSSSDVVTLGQQTTSLKRVLRVTHNDVTCIVGVDSDAVKSTYVGPVFIGFYSQQFRSVSSTVVPLSEVFSDLILDPENKLGSCSQEVASYLNHFLDNGLYDALADWLHSPQQAVYNTGSGVGGAVSQIMAVILLNMRFVKA